MWKVLCIFVKLNVKDNIGCACLIRKIEK